MRKNILTALFLMSGIFFSTTVPAQDFLVTAAGDTLRGKVKAIAYGTDKKVQITEPGKKKVIYPFFKVKTFSSDGEVYEPIKGPSGYTFMKPLKTGYLSLYSFAVDNQTTYTGMFLLKRDGDGLEVPNLTFEKAMKKYLDDCPELVDKIDNDVLNKKDLNQIIDEYNACIGQRTKVGTPVVSSTNVQTPATPPKSMNAWNTLEEKVKAQADFEQKANALEMISEIKAKVASSQKIPNFLIEGLKNSLQQQEDVKTELENALKEVN